MAEMRISDLAEKAGVPTRTIRYYTQQGLLNPPTLRGRVGYYDDGHLERLRLIKELQEKRFLPLSVIASVLRHYEQGASIDTMLVPLDILYQPRWDAAARNEFTRDELAREAGVDVAVVDAAEDMGLLFPTGRGKDKRYTNDDVHMLEVAQKWMDLGIPKSLGRLYRESLEEISQMQVRAFNQVVVAPLTKERVTPEDARDRLIEGYRAMASVFEQLVRLLHRKTLQKTVETLASDEEAG
jgi:DNA-binding transcriptional MerR regulator